ncbi:glycogen phosphorylase [Klebsormidium nitens]|uniref:Alpha-1,4 glucan phosphorylase n=1 Tax=Klebsormidium nitens TaxID=105231 RepID=A0A1Y1IRD9_KLENI|nr:glycogen phosphorylase [Klebsormidium nitens]|eukprot:GAQ92612.1 glycogen phosphorylase [Klebsormidium nitens]
MAFSAVASGLTSAAASCLPLSGSASAHEQVVASPKSAFLSGSTPRSGTALLEKAIVAHTPLQRSARQGRRAGAIRAVAAGPKKTEDVPAAANPASDEAFKVASNIKYHATYTPAYNPLKFDIPQAYRATAQSLRDTLIQRWNDTYALFQEKDPKQTYYLSMEFLQGRALLNAVGNLGVTGAYATALTKLGVSLEEVADAEPDAALGNGGLGRLASCFLDSMATLNYPAWGYGLRYKYGLFHQNITEKGQEEVAERWLEKGNPWEIPRHDVSHTVRFFGSVEEGADGKLAWVGGETVEAVAYDVPIPGYRTKNVISLRLWQATAPAPDFDLYAFNAGEHDKAAHAQIKAEEINLVLYPGDATVEGKLLRLKQQYTLVSASLQDILATFKSRGGRDDGPIDWNLLPEKVAVQMNDTHPTLVIPELIRLLMDQEGLEWDQAWGITKRVAAYTNHTVLPEALEKWPLSLISEMLPRHVSIIARIDDEFIEEYKKANSKLDAETLYAEIASLRILENVEVPGAPKKAEPVKEIKAKAEKSSKEEEEDEAAEPVPAPPPPAPLIHSEIVKDDVFNGFYKLWPDKFQNKTNGVTPRRWLAFCNPELSAVITKWLGSDDWIADLDRLEELRKYADDPKLQEEWTAAKVAQKRKLTAWLAETTGVTVNPESMFDIQVKRIHEYKRQLLNILGVIYKYKKLKEMPAQERNKTVPRVVMFGGKAFATYWQAKRIVKLITDVGRVVNSDPDIGDLLKVVFVPNYNVTVAEKLIPAAELSQHISTAGMEASGTSNMKFALNGCLIIGTLDGANVEIREEIGEDNFFLFGRYAHEIKGLRQDRAEGKFEPDPRFEEAKAFIRAGTFGDYDYEPLLDSLEGNEGFGRGDYFLVGVDFASYLEAQKEVDAAYQDKAGWARKSILSTAGSGKFSSDRTIRQYADEIWKIKPLPVQ